MLINKYKLNARRFRSEGDDDGAGGSGDDLQAKIQAEVDKVKAALEKEYAGLKKTNQDLIAEKRKALEQVKKFEGVDVDALLEMKKHIDMDEDAKLIAEGKMDEVLNKRTERLKRDMETQIDALKTELDKVSKEKDTLAERKKRLLIDGQVRDEAIKAGVRPDAMDYVLRLAREVYDEDENGDVVPRDRNGDLILGKDAKNPMGIGEWVDELRVKAEFVFPSSTGSGASGNKGGKGGWTAEAIANLSPTEYARLRKEGKIK